MQWLIPKSRSFERHVTQDERKLNSNDLYIIRQLCPNLSLKRFAFLSRLDLLTGRLSRLALLDQQLFERWPPLQRYGGVAVLVLNKDQIRHA